MNEIAKCPLCGKNPDVYHAMTSPGQRLLVKIECCDHAVASPLSLIEKMEPVRRRDGVGEGYKVT